MGAYNFRRIKIMKNETRDLSECRRKNDLDLFSPFFEDFFGLPDMRREMRQMDKVMKTDVKETEKGLEFDVDLPGYKKDEIALSIENGYLTIRAEKKHEDNEKDKEGKFVRRERTYGMVSRTFYVGNIDESNVDAKLDNGVLSILLPKQTAKQNKIEIK